MLCSTPLVHPVLKQVLPKAEIRRIRVWRKFQMKASSSQWEEWELPAKEREKAAESRLKERSPGTVVPPRCNKGFKGAKHLEERKQKKWPHVNFNFVQKFHSGSKSYSESLVGNSIFLHRSSASASGKLFPSSWKTSFVKVLACSSQSPKASFEEKTSARHVWAAIWAGRARHRGNIGRSLWQLLCQKPGSQLWVTKSQERKRLVHREMWMCPWAWTRRMWSTRWPRDRVMNFWDVSAELGAVPVRKGAPGGCWGKKLLQTLRRREEQAGTAVSCVPPVESFQYKWSTWTHLWIVSHCGMKFPISEKQEPYQLWVLTTHAALWWGFHHLVYRDQTW